jgi:hypothetical protein
MERQSRAPGRQDGKIGRNGLLVLHSLLFDFLNFKTGRLIPSHQAIATAACISLRSVARGLDRLRDAGVINWLRRCVEERIDGRFTLRQQSNAYHVRPPSQWHGHRPHNSAPGPEPGTWGDPAPGDPLGAFTGATGDLAGRLDLLETDPGDRLAVALARLGKAVIREAAANAGAEKPAFARLASPAM